MINGFVGDEAAWLASLIGADGANGDDGREVELRKTDTHIQWRLTGDEWTDLVSLDDITAPPGADGGGGGALVSPLTSDVTANFTGAPFPWVDSGMQVEMEANQTYEVCACLGILTSATNIGASFGLAGPSGLHSARLAAIMYTTATASAGGTVDAYGEIVDAVNGAGPTTQRLVWLAGVVRNDATAGQLKLQFRVATSESSGSVTLKSPAWFIARKVS